MADRDLTGADYKRRTGPVYQLVWGRKMSPEAAGAFADHVGAQLLITGHQPQDAGYAVNGDRHLIIASDHNQGAFVALSLSEPYTMETMVESVYKFVALDMPQETVQGEAGAEPEPEAEPAPEAEPEPRATPEQTEGV